MRDLSAAWLISYNEERPHDSLGRIPPAEFRRQITGEVSTLKLYACWGRLRVAHEQKSWVCQPAALSLNIKEGVDARVPGSAFSETLENILLEVIKKIIQRILSRKPLTKVRLMIFDVDGVLTDGALWYSAAGEELKAFNVRDGIAIKLLQQNGIEVVFITGGQSGPIKARAQQLGVKKCMVGIADKKNEIIQLIKDHKCLKNEVGYCGDDLNDLPVIDHVGIFFAPADAAIEVKRKSGYILNSSGGAGVAREIAEIFLKRRFKVTEVFDSGWIGRNS